VVVDPEILLLLAKIAELDPELMKNIIIMPPVFHIRKHLIENFMCDPVILLLFGCELYMEFYGLQVQKQIQKADTLILKMTQKITNAENKAKATLKKRADTEIKAAEKRKRQAEKDSVKNAKRSKKSDSIAVEVRVEIEVENDNENENENLIIESMNVELRSAEPENEVRQINAVHSVVQCAARSWINQTDDSDDEEEQGANSDDDEEAMDSDPVGPAKFFLFNDQKLEDVLIMSRKYTELGLRGGDPSNELKSLKINFARYI
jgi:hypothetical protein